MSVSLVIFLYMVGNEREPGKRAPKEGDKAPLLENTLLATLFEESFWTEHSLAPYSLRQLTMSYIHTGLFSFPVANVPEHRTRQSTEQVISTLSEIHPRTILFRGSLTANCIQVIAFSDQYWKKLQQAAGRQMGESTPVLAVLAQSDLQPGRELIVPVSESCLTAVYLYLKYSDTGTILMRDNARSIQQDIPEKDFIFIREELHSLEQKLLTAGIPYFTMQNTGAAINLPTPTALNEYKRWLAGEGKRFKRKYFGIDSGKK